MQGPYIEGVYKANGKWYRVAVHDNPHWKWTVVELTWTDDGAILRALPILGTYEELTDEIWNTLETWL